MRFRIVILGTLFAVNVFVWTTMLRANGATLTVAFLDVGQGDAIFIESPSGNQVLVDAGANAAVLRGLAERMGFFDRTIDLVIATHPDKDHVGGMREVLGRYRVLGVMDPGISGGTAIFKEYERRADAEGAARLVARRGQTIDFGDGVVMHILFPDRDMTGVETNAASVTARMVYGETEVLLSGDAPQSIERYLLMLNKTALASDILKAGHHGSKTSSDAQFVAAVSPDYAVISAGKDNSYGHPHQEVIDTLTAAGATILETSKRGTIVFTSDGATVHLLK